MSQLHATAIAFDGVGVLIRGPSGSGKSDLALRLIEAGGDLIADDRVEVARVDDRCLLSAPDTIKGLLEVRGLGVVDLGAVQDVPLGLVVDLKSRDKIERMPEPQEELVEGVSIRVLDIDAFEVSAPAKIKMALRIQGGKVSLIE